MNLLCHEREGGRGGEGWEGGRGGGTGGREGGDGTGRGGAPQYLYNNNVTYYVIT